MEKLYDKNGECLCYFNMETPAQEEYKNHNHEINCKFEFCDADGKLIDRKSHPLLRGDLLFIEQYFVEGYGPTYKRSYKYVLSSISEHKQKMEKYEGYNWSSLIILNSLNSEIWGDQGYRMNEFGHDYEWQNENILLIDRSYFKHSSFLTRPKFYDENQFFHVIIKDSIDWHCYVCLWHNEKYMLIAKNYENKDNAKMFTREERIILYSIEDNTILWEKKGYFIFLNINNTNYIDIGLKEEIAGGKIVWLSAYRVENGCVTCLNHQRTKMLLTCFFDSPSFFSNGYFSLNKKNWIFIFNSNYKIVLILSEKHQNVIVQNDEKGNYYIECNANIEDKWMRVTMDMTGKYINAKYPSYSCHDDIKIYRKYQEIDSRKQWKEGVLDKDTEIIPIVYDGIQKINFGGKYFYEVHLDVGNNQILAGLYRENEMITDLINKNEFYFGFIDSWDVTNEELKIDQIDVQLANYPDHVYYIPSNSHFALLKCKNKGLLLIDGDINNELLFDNVLFIPYYKHVPRGCYCLSDEHIAFSINTENGTKKGIINREGKVVIPAKYDKLFAYGDILLADNDIYHYSADKFFVKIFEITLDKIVGWKYDNLILLSSQTNKLYAYNVFDKSISHPVDNELLATTEYDVNDRIHFFDCEKRIFTTKKKEIIQKPSKSLWDDNYIPTEEEDPRDIGREEVRYMIEEGNYEP